MFFATFVLSTGRCGTQWLAENFSAYYGDRVCVRHEPLHDGYRARAMLGVGNPERLEAEAAAPILAHMDFIEAQLKRGDYLECGHPCWSTIPYLLERFRGRVRVLHLVRDPVATSLSWLTHSAYQKPLLPHLREKILLSPFDGGTALTDYCERWAALSAYEKCLYYWAEVNQFALSLQPEYQAPWLRIRFEDLFADGALDKALRFMELPSRAGIFESRSKPLDRFRYLAPELPLPGTAVSHPRIEVIAQALAYTLEKPVEAAMKARYFGQSIPARDETR
jgi:hypothetical protein